ncbi:hypothetical protein GUJ93_ZPchr0002g24594 [Zizania palustris]|uniref:Uncharacterized protein n=1 Tax=Zizania palustris TaxID=103762 RepID=A0A8J5RWZ7_ZIZPA|nr:hypothetical protein GUJ93_ZPchr0002g24594 [Zizania palustris]
MGHRRVPTLSPPTPTKRGGFLSSSARSRAGGAAAGRRSSGPRRRRAREKPGSCQRCRERIRLRRQVIYKSSRIRLPGSSPTSRGELQGTNNQLFST